MKKRLSILALFALCLFTAASAFADGQVTFRWTPRPAEEQTIGYIIYDNGVIKANIDGGSVDISTLPFLTGPHSVTISSYNSVGESAQSGAILFNLPSGVAAEPAGLSVEVIGGLANLSWNIPSTDEYVTSWDVFLDGVLFGSVTTTRASGLDVTAVGDHVVQVYPVSVFGRGPIPAQVTITTLPPVPPATIPTEWRITAITP